MHRETALFVDNTSTAIKYLYFNIKNKERAINAFLAQEVCTIREFGSHRDPREMIRNQMI